MDTNNLIDALARDLKPVRPLPAPHLRALVFAGLTAALVVLALVVLGGPRTEWPASMAAEALLMASAGLAAAAAAFRLAVPDTRIRPATLALLSYAVTVWATLIVHAFTMMPEGGMRAELAETGSVACVIGLLAMTSIPLSLAMMMVWRASPVWRGLAGAMAWLAAASFGAAGMRFLCANDGIGHLLLWHFMPVLALAALGTLAGRLLLKRL